tara:strand:+ start:940 stop:1581 length:642 start_codon:yes stop_codon:yes gene_type:complete
MASAKKDNMELWNKVCRTDPAHTKHVGQRGGFTAIDAMYQIECATKEFGPVGVGWGWDFELMFPPNDTVIAVVTLWHTKRDQTVKQVGQKSLGSGRVDEDATKKAVTDGLTKCLSYLGFNADVFLGKFDDNKYVEQVRTQFNKPQIVTDFETIVKTASNSKDLEAIYEKDYKRQLIACVDEDANNGGYVKAVVEAYRKKLTYFKPQTKTKEAA